VTAMVSYSRFVRWLKLGLPLVALGLMSAIFLLPGQKGFNGGLIYTTAELLALGEGLAVSNPSFSGSTEDGEPFLVRADSATPDKPDPELVTLDNVFAEIDMKDGRKVTLTALAGTLRPKADTLSLTGGVKLVTSDGYVVTTESADANVKTGRLVAAGPVDAKGPRGTIASGSFRMLRADRNDDDASGDFLWFENRVKVTFVPEAAK